MEQELKQSVKLPRVVRLLRASDLASWSNAFLLVGQLLGISEEIVYSISSTSSNLEAVWGTRFKGINRAEWPPMTGTQLVPEKFMVLKASGLAEDGKHVEPASSSSSEEAEAEKWLKSEQFTPAKEKASSLSLTPVGIGSGKRSVVPLSKEFRQLMFVGRNEEQQISLSSKTKFINMITWTVEPSSKLTARISAWRWLISSLMQDDQVKGPYFHVTVGIDLYDVCSAYTAIKKMLGRKTILRWAKDIKRFHALSSSDFGGSLPTFFSALTEAAAVINETSESLLTSGGMDTQGYKVTPFLVVAAVIEDAAKDPRYRSYLERMAEDPDKYAALMDAGVLVQELMKYEDQMADFSSTLVK